MRNACCVLCLIALIAGACRRSNNDVTSASQQTACAENESTIPIRHALRFSAWQGQGYKRLLIYASDSGAAPFGYLLLDSSTTLDSGCYPGYLRIRLPVHRAVCVSTTHAALFSILDKRQAMVGMSWADNLYDAGLRSRWHAGQLLDVSREGDLNMETILDLEPDLVMTYLTADPEYGDFNKLRELGIPVLPNAEFLESHPLGQAEWLRLAGWLLACEERADSIFGAVESRYVELRELAAGTTSRPKVFTGLEYQGNWTVPKAGSFAATLLRDAGAQYCWDDQPGSGSLAVDFESVMERAASAGFWLNPGAARSRKQLEDLDPRLKNFKAWQDRGIYNNDARMSPGGGNDYWESAILRPDLVLSDLVAIFHPGLREQDSLIYYRRIP